VSSRTAWEPPSTAAADLIRAVAEQILRAPQALLEELDAATLQITDAGLAADPALVAGNRQTSRSNVVHWATANIRRPGQPVTANVSPGTLDFARDVVRRGLDDASLNSYRVGQNVVWRHWMDTAFGLTSDVALLGEMLDITYRSMAAYVDATLAGIREQIDREREQLLSGMHAERLQVVSLILDGAPITARRASMRLRYELAPPHTAYIVWTDAPGLGHGELERTAGELARAAGARRPLTVAASVSSLWAWSSTDAGFDAGAFRDAVPADSGIRVALGSTLPGIDGFRRSHHDAIVTQRLMRRMPGELRFAGHRDVHLVALAAQDDEDAADFVDRTIGDLASADPELRDTLRTYIREQFNTTRTAKVLFTHRNTILNRLARAEGLLPAPLAGRGLEVGLALEIVHWLGVRA
jgi:DNA-binding PucR family transcriptional regulator